MPSLFAALPVVTLRQAEGAVDGANDDNELMSDENGVVVLVVLMTGSGTNGLIAIASIVAVATVATNPTKANPSIIHLPHLGWGGGSEAAWALAACRARRTRSLAISTSVVSR